MLAHYVTVVVAIATFLAIAIQTYVWAIARNVPRKYQPDLTHYLRGMWVIIALAYTAMTIFLCDAFLEADWGRIAGEGVIVLALALRIWAQTALWRNWSRGIAIRDNHRLIKHGPYALVRHPMYTAYGLIFVGTLTASALWMAYPTTLIWLLTLQRLNFRADLEEKILLKHFGEEYKKYRSLTWKYLPGVW